jgi:hypothetical protein
MEKADDTPELLLVGDGFALDEERELGGGTGSDSYVAIIVRVSADRPSSLVGEKLQTTSGDENRFRAEHLVKGK